MTIIRAICPSCGKVEMRTADISLEVSDDGGSSRYRFACPTCTVEVSKRADRQSVAMLMAAGIAPIDTTHIPLPTDDRTARDPGPAFTLDDVSAFHDLLQDDALIAELLSNEQ